MTKENQETFYRNFARKPDIHPSVYIAPLTYLSGNIRIGENSSIWPQCSLRGDIREIIIGEASNIQDGSVIHVDMANPTIIGNYVTVGHKAIIHACTIEDEVLIGMGATILDGAKIGRRSIIGANALVTKGTEIPPGSLVLGAPAKVVKTLDDEAQSTIRGWAEHYVFYSREYLKQQNRQTE